MNTIIIVMTMAAVATIGGIYFTFLDKKWYKQDIAWQGGAIPSPQTGYGSGSAFFYGIT